MAFSVLFCFPLIQASDGRAGAAGQPGTRRAVAAWDGVGELTAPGVFYFASLCKDSRLPANTAAVCRNNSAAEGGRQAGCLDASHLCYWVDGVLAFLGILV